jgi:hypothetical protein
MNTRYSPARLAIRIVGVTLLIAITIFFTSAAASAQQEPGAIPLKPNFADGAQARWLAKKVLATRSLDTMDDLSNWTFAGDGEMKLSEDRLQPGTHHSLRMVSLSNAAKVRNDGEWQDLLATRHFAGEDWRAYNRISLCVYSDIAGAPAISLNITLHNDGAHKLPDPYNEGRNESIPLDNHAWTHVVWEIEPLDRDRITALDFGYSLPKMYADPGDRTMLYLANLELEQVVPDYVEGWQVAPGVISFSHSGYTAGASKTALATGVGAQQFSLVRADTGEVVLVKAVEQKVSALGTYQVFDFSEVQKPGQYLLRAGDVSTRAFRIGDDAFESSIWKAINFMYSERCGTVIPGIHGVCHQDDYTAHGDQRIAINGGYHDAGDLSATGNTPGMVFGLLSFADRLKTTEQDAALRQRMLDEARWGLAWVLKTRFGEGFRSTGQLISYWTNGIMGDADDRHGEAVNDPEWNFRVSAVEALAARVFKDSDPELANRSLATAEDDWKFAVRGLETAAPVPEIYGAKDDLERTSFAVISSLELYHTTGEQQYADEAVKLGANIVASQERKVQPWTLPLTGYFYTSPKRENLFHRFHIGQEEQPVVALAMLCDALPDNADWMKWYSAIVLHSEYYQMAAVSIDAPFDVLPAAVYRESEARLLPDPKAWTPLRAADRNAYVAEVRQGFPLGGEYYLRRFPVWFDFRGNSSVLLSEAKALSVAGRIRGNLDAEDLAQKQAQWLVGRNPFSASIMYGEGYDWTPLYSVRSGQMVGALPVGIETRGFNDAPYWPNQICWTYKEVWTQPVGEWVWLMEDLSGSALVRGIADAGTVPVIFRDRKTGHTVTATPEQASGAFRVMLPQGTYDVEQGSTRTSLVALTGQVYDLELRAGRAFDFAASSSSAPGNLVTLEVAVTGSGKHSFGIRSDNLKILGPEKNAELKEVQLTAGVPAHLTWRVQVIDPDTPWVAVIVPDATLSARKELTGVSDSRQSRPVPATNAAVSSQSRP